jgi:predicted DNA-binding transcriptional regulator YafY
VIDKETSRLSRLMAMVTLLQSRKLSTSTQLAKKFKVSVRTIYRNIRALEQSGIPIITEEGKGYSLMEGYTLPPIMFTEDEANALVTAERLVQVNKDISLIKNYTGAVTKIKSVLRSVTKDKAQILSERVEFWKDSSSSIPVSDMLSTFQTALTNLNILRIEYDSHNNNEITKRDIEPFALINKVGENWYLIAWCRRRKDYRLFRFDRIKKIKVTEDKFKPHKMSLQEFLDNYRKNNVNTPDARLS